MSTKSLTHEAIARALSNGDPLTQDQRATLLSLVADDKVWQRECDRLSAALAEQAQPVAWTPVSQAMPKSGAKVLACYRNRLGNLRRIRAEWIAAKTREADSEDAEACVEYDEATDTYYTTEGWYECIDNWGDYSSVAVTEGEVTHWMPLPPEPGAAPEALTPPAPQPLTEQEMYKIEDRARREFKLSQRGPKGQQITYWDSLTPWLIRAVEAAVLERMGVQR